MTIAPFSCLLLGQDNNSSSRSFSSCHLLDGWTKAGDDFSFIAFFPVDLLNALNCSPGDTVRIQSVERGKKGKDGSVLRRCQVLEADMVDHLKLHDDSPFFAIACSSVYLQVHGLHDVMKVNPVEYHLKKLTLSRVTGQTYLRKKSEESCLLWKWVKERERFVLPGDVIPVCYLEDSENIRRTHDMQPAVFWYSVLDVEVAGRIHHHNCHNSDYNTTYSCLPLSTTVVLNESIKAPHVAKLSFMPSTFSLFKELLCGAVETDIVESSSLEMHLRRMDHLLLGRKSLDFVFRAYSTAVVQSISPCVVLRRLAQFAYRHSMKMYCIDYRQFVYSSFDADTDKVINATFCMRSYDNSEDLAPPSIQILRTTMQLKALTTSSSPCLVCITGLDTLSNIASTADAKLKRTADDSLCAFIHRLFSPEGGASPQQNIALFGTTSSGMSNLSPSVLEYFPQQLVDERDIVGIDIHFRSKRKSRIISKEIAEEDESNILLSVCKDYSAVLGPDHLEHFVQEARLLTLQRNLYSDWAQKAFRVSPSGRVSHTQDSRSLRVCHGGMYDMAGMLKRARWGIQQNEDTIEDSCSTAERKEGSLATVHWDDVGGVESVREELLESLLLASRCSSEAAGRRKIPRRTGVLLHGPPGTGKTLIAKALASECGMTFLSVKGPELLDMYIGESERHVRILFEKARRLQPCILFFDELDSLAPARGQGSGGASGVLDRVVSQLLIEMDNLQEVSRGTAHSLTSAKRHGSDNTSMTGVFVVGATNRPDLLDSALLRPGRFDKKVFLGPYKSCQAKYKVLVAQTRGFNLNEDVDLDQIAELLIEQTVSGAEIGAIVSMAHEYALNRKLQHLEKLSTEWQGAKSPTTDLNPKCFAATCRRSRIVLQVSEFIDEVDNDNDILCIQITSADFHAAIRNAPFPSK